MFLGVSLGIVNLSKPFAEIDAAAKVRRASLGESCIGLGETGGRDKDRNQQDHFAHRDEFLFSSVLLRVLWGWKIFEPQRTQRQGLIPSAQDRQRPYALLGRRVNGIAQSRCEWRHGRLSGAGWWLCAGHKIGLDPRSLVHADGLIVVEVALHHTSFVDRDLCS